MHTFQVRAVSLRLGSPLSPDPSPAQRSFVLVAPPPPPAPDTAITAGPDEGSTVIGTISGGTLGTNLFFDFSSIGGEDPYFECSLDGQPFERCYSGSPV